MTTDSNATHDEARELARRWPWSLAPHEKSRLRTLTSEWMANEKRHGRIESDLGEWLGRDIDDAHTIAREAMTGLSFARGNIVDDLVNEIHRLREALRLIANGHISPSMSYARRVLDGEDPREALTAEIAAARARP